MRAQRKEVKEELTEWRKGEDHEERFRGGGEDKSVRLRTSAEVKWAREGRAHDRRMVL